MSTYTDVMLSGYTLKLAISEPSYSVTNNTSSVHAVLSITKGTGSGKWATGNSSWHITLNGTTYSDSGPYDFRDYSTLVLMSKTVTIKHNTDGTKTVTVSGAFNDIVSSGGIGDGSISSKSYDLTDIPRASTPTFSPDPIVAGQLITVQTNAADSSFTHDISITFGSTTAVIASGVSSVATWTPALSLLNEIPNAMSGGGTMTTTTHNSSGTVIGTTTVPFTLTAPSTVVPTIGSVTVTENVAAIASAVGKYVQGASKLNLAINGAAGVYGSTITSYKITVESQVINAQSGVSTALLGSGAENVIATITDSRNQTATATVPISVLPYAAPTIDVNTLDFKRCLIDGTLNEDGTYVKVTFTGAVQSLLNGATQKNALTYRLSSAAHGVTPLTVKATVTPGGITFTGSKVIGTSPSNLYDVDKSWDVLLEVSDLLATSAVQRTVATSAIFMHWNGTAGMGLGKYHQQGSLDGKGQFYQNDGKKVIDASMVATTAAAGVVNLATDAEATTGTDAAKAVTPHALSAAVSAALTAALAARDNANAPVKVAFSAVTQVTIPCSGFDEYEVEWEVTISTGQLIMRIGTSGVPLTTALYDSNNVYAAGTNATPTSGGDMNEMATSWHITPASSSSRNLMNGLARITNLNIAQKARIIATVGSNIEGGTSTTINSTAAAAVSGNHRTTNATQNELYLLSSTVGATITGWYVLKKIKYAA